MLGRRDPLALRCYTLFLRESLLLIVGGLGSDFLVIIYLTGNHWQITFASWNPQSPCWKMDTTSSIPDSSIRSERDDPSKILTKVCLAQSRLPKLLFTFLNQPPFSLLVSLVQPWAAAAVIFRVLGSCFRTHLSWAIFTPWNNGFWRKGNLESDICLSPSSNCFGKRPAGRNHFLFCSFLAPVRQILISVTS